MKNYLVITSIFPPTEAVHAFSKLENIKVIVVGDKKSPDLYDCNSVEFLSCNDQALLDYKIIDTLPFNHYCRKMIGYLHAIRKGADVIIDTDDDNIPNSNWLIPNFEGDFLTLGGDRGFVNIYELFTDEKIWPRGLPLRLINSKTLDKVEYSKINSKIGIWQGLADGDPDVDAIYRLTNGNLVKFDKHHNVVLDAGTISPFNSQNTFIRKELFPLLYLPASVTFRFTDILRSLVAQPIMWAAGYKLGFTEATVVQERNPHDYTNDFKSEIPMYLYTDKVMEICTNVVSSNKSIFDNLHDSYNELEKSGIVLSSEMTILNAWISDLARI